MHFTPLRQILSGRSQRRLHRNRLSEETNAIAQERKEERGREIEIRRLRTELARVQEANHDADGTSSSSSNDAHRIPELEAEIRTLKAEARSRSGTAEPNYPTPSADDDDVAFVTAVDCERDELPSALVDTPPETPTTPCPRFDACSTRGTQTHLTGPSDLETHVTAQTGHLVAARLALERLCPGETPLGLSPAGGDAAPVLGALLDRLRAAHAERRDARAALQAARTSLAAARTHEANTRGHFDGALRQLDAARTEGAALRAVASQQETQIRTLRREADERGTDAQRLGAALAKYRDEVRALEELVERAEGEGRAACAALRAQTDEAVADLECAVAAETRGRRAAEEACAAQGARARALEQRERELRGAVHEKQALVRTLEDDAARERAGRADEVGRLNVRVAELSERLAAARAEVERGEGARCALLQRLAGEVQEGERVRGELKGLVEGWEPKGCGEAGVGGGVGLLTPVVEGGRFRDAASEALEGRVEMKRGRGRKERKVDSGIGILEEDVAAEDDAAMFGRD